MGNIKEIASWYVNIFSLYSLACVFLPCILYQLFLVCKGRKNGKKCKKEYFIWLCIFLFYIWMVFQVTGVGLLADVLRTDKKLFTGGVNLVPFASFGMGYILNIIMCMPLGFLLPFIWKECRSLGRTAFTGAAFSLLIELSQLFNYRSLDIDDLTANILGTIAGYLIWSIAADIRKEMEKKRRKRKIRKIHNEEEEFMKFVTSEWEIPLPVKHVKGHAQVYLFLSLAGTFFLYNPYLLY